MPSLKHIPHLYHKFLKNKSMQMLLCLYIHIYLPSLYLTVLTIYIAQKEIYVSKNKMLGIFIEFSLNNVKG